MIGFSPTIDIGDRTFQRTYGSSHIRSLVVYIMTTGSKRRSRDPGPIMFADHWEDPQERVLAESRGLNQSTEDWYTHAAALARSSAAIFSTTAVTAGS